MSDFSLKCYDGPWFGMLVIALAVLAIFSIGVPAGFALVLYNRRDKLEDPEVKRLFAMLYQPYKPEYYFFESIVIMFKLILMVALVFTPQGSMYQHAAIVMVCVVNLFTQARFQPYSTTTKNALQYVGTFVTFAMSFGGMLMQHMRVSQDEAAARLSGIDKEKADQEYELGIWTIQYTLDAVLIASIVPTCIALLYRQWKKRKENAAAVGNLARGVGGSLNHARRSATRRFSNMSVVRRFSTKRQSTQESKGNDNDGDVELPDMAEESVDEVADESVEVKVDGEGKVRTTIPSYFPASVSSNRGLTGDGNAAVKGRREAVAAEYLDLPATFPRRSAGGRAWENPNPMYGQGTKTQSKEGHDTAALEIRSSSTLSKTVTCGVSVGVSGAAWMCGTCKAVNAKSASVCLKCKAVRTQEAPTTAAAVVEAARGGVGGWGASPTIGHGDGGANAKPAPDHENAPARPRSRSRRLRDILKHANAAKSAGGGGAKYGQQGVVAEETPAPTTPVPPPPAVPQTPVPKPTLPPPPPMVSPPPLPEEMQLSGMGRTQSMEL